LVDTFIETQQVYGSSDGMAVETVMQAILDDNSTGVTLYTPSSPGWMLKEFVQAKQPVLDALRQLADQIGWDARYRRREATSRRGLRSRPITRSAPTSPSSCRASLSAASASVTSYA